MVYRLLLCCFFVCITQTVVAIDNAGPVWKVTKGEHAVFIGGTIHVLGAADYPLPRGFNLAYQQADVLVFEADVSQMQTPEVQHLIIDKTQYKNGVTLKKTLAPSTYSQLQTFLQARGNDIRQLESFKPGMVTMILTLNEIERLGQLGQGVDDFYHQKAQADRKPTLFLETMEQQITFLSSMGEGQEDDLLIYTFKELDNLDVQLAQLKTAWRSGSNAQLIKVGLAPWLASFPRLYDALLVQRNMAWLPQVDAMLLTPEVEYILVGALHLPGEKGMLNLFRERGYRIEQLQ